MFFKQFRDNGCLSYIIADEITKRAAVIDPSVMVDQYLQALSQKDFALDIIIDTHSHADHISGAGLLAKKSGAKVMMSENTPIQRGLGASAPDAIRKIVDENGKIPVSASIKDGQVLKVGDVELKSIFAPGHNKDIMCLELSDRILTGDSLMIGHVGRMDLPGSDVEEMYDSIHKLTSILDDDMIIYPGHDYSGNINSTVGYEKVNNEFLTIKTKEEFARIAPTKFAPLSGQGMQCGTISTPAAPSFKEGMIGMMAQAFMKNPQNLVYCRDLKQKLGQVPVLDVRESDELARTGKIPGALHVPLEQVSSIDVSKLPPRGSEIVVNCAGGGRSALAALFLQNMGWKAKSLEGGIVAWMKEGNATEK